MKKIDTVPKEKRGVIVALDVAPKQAIKLASQLPEGAIVKVAPTLYFQFPPVVDVLMMMGLRIMWDFKSKDIPFQVHGSVGAYLRSGIAFFTVHADGGTKMLKEAVASRDAWMDGAEGGLLSPLEIPKILAVTVLTSQGDEDMKELGIPRKPASQVARLAGIAMSAGVDGFVCSPREASIIRRIAGPRAFIVTPGVRFPEGDVGDQERVGTPQGAIRAGASHVVVGRPITGDDDPAMAFCRHYAAVMEVE